MESLLGYIVALILSTLSLAGFATWAKIGVMNVRTAATASQQVIFNKGAQLYVKDRAAEIATQATASVPVSVTTATLIAGNYLPPGFSPNNAFGQSWLLQVLQPTPNNLQTLVTSQGGFPITDTRQLVQIAAQAGAQGGFVPYVGQNGDTTMVATDAYGAFGAWRVSLANFTNPGSGHLASLLAFGGAQANNGYLYRVQVPGHPELNQMQTSLDMGGNDVNNAEKVTANTFVNNGDLVMNGAAAQNTSCTVPHAQRRNSTTNAGNVICEGGIWQPIGTGVVNVGQGTACGVEGQGATNSNNQFFICKNGVYVAITNFIPKNVEMGRYVVGDNNVAVPKPSCAPGGTQSWSFEPRTMGSDFSQAPPYTAVRYGADEYAGAWVPRILLVNMNGAVNSGNVLGLQGVFKSECYYP